MLCKEVLTSSQDSLVQTACHTGLQSSSMELVASNPRLGLHIKRSKIRTSLVVQWTRNPPANEGTRVRSKVREDQTVATVRSKPVCHNYSARELQLLKFMLLEPVLYNKRSRCTKTQALQ